MIEGRKPDPFMLPPGPERRALMRELEVKIGTDDFSDEEWAEIEAEASGTQAAMKALAEDR